MLICNPEQHSSKEQINADHTTLLDNYNTINKKIKQEWMVYIRSPFSWYMHVVKVAASINAPSSLHLHPLYVDAQFILKIVHSKSIILKLPTVIISTFKNRYSLYKFAVQTLCRYYF